GGLVFVKGGVVAWRTPVPQCQAAEHVEFREETRKYYLKVCDWNRVVVSAGILFWAIQLSVSPDGINRLLNIWFAVLLVIAVVSTVLVEFKRKRLVTLALRALPVKLPDFLSQSN